MKVTQTDSGSDWKFLCQSLIVFTDQGKSILLFFTSVFRGNVKYLAQTDLDEMIFVGKGRSIIKFMETMDKQEPEMAAVSFRSQRVQVTVSFLSKLIVVYLE